MKLGLIFGALISSGASLAVLSGCGFIADPPGSTSTKSNPSANNNSSTENDGSDPTLNALEAKLSAQSSQAFDNTVQELDPAGNDLYYKTYPGFDPALHKKTAAGATIDYSFSLGSGDDANDRTSANLVVVAENTGDQVVYHAYDASQPNSEATNSSFPAPSADVKWWAYAVDASTVYVVTTPDGATSTTNDLYAFSAGNPAQKLFSLEDLGMQVGELDDFDVQGTTMMLIESGRLWKIDLSAKKATWLKNQTEITGAVDFEKDGCAWEDADGLEYFDYTQNAVRSLSTEIQNSSYEIDATYNTAHYYYAATSGANFTRYQDWVVYTANMGIFAYNLTSQQIAPVLINEDDANGHTIQYVYPVVLDTGAAFVVGLTSDDGDTGADGPVYTTNLPALLPSQ